MTPLSTTHPRRRIEVWRPPAAAPRRRPPSPAALPQAPPVPIEQQLAALEAELRAWAGAADLTDRGNHPSQPANLRMDDIPDKYLLQIAQAIGLWPPGPAAEPLTHRCTTDTQQAVSGDPPDSNGIHRDPGHCRRLPVL